VINAEKRSVRLTATGSQRGSVVSTSLFLRLGVNEIKEEGEVNVGKEHGRAFSGSRL
jgi:hypothetical protein